MTRLRLLADEAIHGLSLLEPIFNVVSMPGRKICAEHLTDAHGLLVRSVTAVNEPLLARASSLQFVGSATIGTDHVDLDYLLDRQIRFAHAPGCNANAVVDYVLFCLFNSWGLTGGMEKTFGIVGCGNVGGRLLGALREMGIKARVYDPYLEGITESCSFEEVLECETISVHVPLTREGSYPTENIISAELLESLLQRRESGAKLLINSSRGEIVEAGAITSDMNQRIRFVNDVWRDEPAIDAAELKASWIATPHIAGHSIAGKRRGSQMIFRALAAALDLKLPRRQLCDDAFMPADAVVSFETMLKGGSESFSAKLAEYCELQDLSDAFKRLGASSRNSAAMGLLFDQVRAGSLRRSECDYAPLKIEGV